MSRRNFEECVAFMVCTLASAAAIGLAAWAMQGGAP